MLRAALLAVLAMLALPATASAAQGSASLAVCAPDERAAEFDARMTRVPGTAKMKMRFLLERRKPGSLRYRRVSAPGFSRWTSSQAARYVFTRHVEGLTGPARHRAQVRFRWIDADGEVIATDRAWSRSCWQPDHRPNLKLRSLTVLTRTSYVAVVSNTGRSATDAFDLQLAVDGQEQHTPVASLDPGETRHVNITGPRCTGQAAAFADPLDLVDERVETDNAAVVSC